MTLPPCLYMLWPTGRRRIAEPAVAPCYRLKTLQRGDDQAVIELIGSDGETMGKAEWQHYQNMLLPDGLFLIEQVGGCLIATAGAAHNPDPGRHYYVDPFRIENPTFQWTLNDLNSGYVSLGAL